VSDNGPIKPNEQMGRLVPDPENPDVLRLVGFRLGVSDRDAYWRLYLDADLSDYLEFRKESVLDGKEYEETTTVWLRPDAKVTHTRTLTAAMGFLSGGLAAEFLRPTGFLGRATGLGRVGTGTGTLNPTVCCFTRGGGQGGIT
jgi:hypothetical protein